MQSNQVGRDYFFMAFGIFLGLFFHADYTFWKSIVPAIGISAVSFGLWFLFERIKNGSKDTDRDNE